MKKIFDTIIFSNFYIALAAVMMCYTSQRLFGLFFDKKLAVFVFFATLCSYSLHWFLTSNELKTPRMTWTNNNRNLLKLLFLVGAAGTSISFFYLFSLWKIILPLALLTFFYTAPKIPFRFFYFLKGFAAAKTFYLAIVWFCVTVVLPFEDAKIIWTNELFLFATNRFLLIVTVCILFDYRDRDEDFGIKNFITYFDEKKLNIAFYFNTFCFAFTCFLLKNTFSYFETFALVLPFFVLASTFFISKKTKNEYWFYVVLDGVMMLSGIILTNWKIVELGN